MSDFDLPELTDLTIEVLQKGDQSKLKQFIDKVDLYLIVEERTDGDSFPDSVFEFILKLMDCEMFLTMEGSSKLLLVFETDWARLSDDQKSKLLDAIETSYARFKDWMSSFILSELLGQYYRNENAFDVLSRLRNTSNITARSLLAHGFEHIAREAEGKKLRERAISKLMSMTQDPSPEVHNEAVEALAKIPTK